MLENDSETMTDVSNETLSSYLSNDLSISDFSSFEDNELFQEQGIESFCPEFKYDVEKMWKIFGHDSLVLKEVAFGMATCEIFVMPRLRASACQAWGITTHVPIRITLQISTKHYLAENIAKIKIDQNVEKFVPSSQMVNIMSKYCKQKCDSKYNFETILKLQEMGFKKPEAIFASGVCESLEQSVRFLLENIAPDNGFFVEFVDHFHKRLSNLNEHCVVCDKKHLYNLRLLKPAVCHRDLCAFAYQQLNVMAESAHGLAVDQTIMDLLVSMARVAANSGRAKLIFNPFPTVFDPKSPHKNPILNPKKPNYDLAKQLLNTLTFSKLTSANFDNPLQESLVHWIINSNRCHLARIPYQISNAWSRTRRRNLYGNEFRNILWLFWGFSLCNANSNSNSNYFG